MFINHQEEVEDVDDGNTDGTLPTELSLSSLLLVSLLSLSILYICANACCCVGDGDKRGIVSNGEDIMAVTCCISDVLLFLLSTIRGLICFLLSSSSCADRCPSGD